MRTTLLVAVTLSALATGAFAHDPSGRPEVGTFAPHVTGTTGDGRPEIHRPPATSHDAASAGVGTQRGGADDTSVTRLGPGRGNVGFPQGARVVGNEDGRPVVEHGHQPAGTR